MRKPTFSNDVLSLLEATGGDWQDDLAKLKFGVVTPEELLAFCLDGADAEDREVWESYVTELEITAERTLGRDIASTWNWDAYGARALEIGSGEFHGTPRALEEHVRDQLLEADFEDGSFLVCIRATAPGRELEAHILMADLGDAWRSTINPSPADLRDAGLNESGLPL